MYNQSLADFESAALSSGFTVSNKRRNRFNISSAACHGGDSATICWITEEDGKAIAHCHKCGFPNSDKNIRTSLGMNVFEEWPEPQNVEERRPWKTEVWPYYTTDGKSALHKVFRHHLACTRKDCEERGPHKHSSITRDAKLKGTPLEMGYQVHLHRPADKGADHLVVVCEGQKTAESVASLGYTGVSYIQGSGYAGKADYRSLAGEESVIVSPDNDASGIKAALESTIALLQVGVSRVTILNNEHFPSNGGDLADLSDLDRLVVLHEQRGTVYESSDHATAHLSIHNYNTKCKLLPNSRLKLMDVYDSHILHEQVEDVWDGVIKHLVTNKIHRGTAPEVYEYHGDLIELSQMETGMKAIVVSRDRGKTLVSKGMFWHKGWDNSELLALNAEIIEDTDWQTVSTVIDALIPTPHGQLVYEEWQPPMDKDKEKPHIWKVTYPKPNYPNTTISNAVVAHKDFRLPHLAGIIERPMLDSESKTIMTTTGYHNKEKVFLQWSGSNEVPPLADGLAILDTVFGEFPFDSASSKANFYGCLLSGFIGLACPIKPLFMFNKATPRTGATLLAGLVSLIMSGKNPTNAGPLHAKNDEDNGKAISSAAYKSECVVLMDNMVGQIDSAALATYITSDVYETRKLGSNTDHLTIDRRPLVDIATSNNPSLTFEILKRTVNIRIDPKMEDPSTRTFKIEHIQQYVLDNREMIINAILSMVKHWLDAGAPYHSNLNVMGGFNQWRNITSSILTTCGVEGFLSNVEDDEDTLASDAISEERGLVAFWLDIIGYAGVTVSEIAAAGALGDEEDSDADLIFLGIGKRNSRLTRLGHHVRGMVGKVYEFKAGLKVTVARTGLRPHNKIQYRLERFSIPQEFTEDCTVECGESDGDTAFIHAKGCVYA